jgi:hypothetical protein
LLSASRVWSPDALSLSEHLQSYILTGAAFMISHLSVS